jgi:small subunit ribosomal protein S14
MATTAKIAKDIKLDKALKAARALGKKGRATARAQGKAPKMWCRHRNRCWRCGRPRAFLRKYGICRLCFRQLALNGEIPGVTKASW